MLGVLGGMGPAATVDFMAKLIRLTPVTRDQEHVPLVVVSDPRVPDRVGPILRGAGEDPLPAMIEGLRRLERAGASAVAIPCHTAHHWADGLRAATGLPLIHIVDAVLAELARRAAADAPVGLLATAATLAAGFYQDRLGRAGHPAVLPEAAVMEGSVLPAILAVKQGRAADAAPLLAEAIARLEHAGAAVVLLACTELPLALPALGPPPAACLDATEALARACIQWYRAQPELR